MTRWPLVAALLVLTACRAEREATAVLLVVDSDLRLGEELPFLRIDVFTLGGQPLTFKEFELPTSIPGGALPLSIPIVPEDGARGFRVRVQGGVRTDQGLVTSVEKSAIASFREEEETVLALVLERACEKVACSALPDAPEQTCEGGKCIEVVDRELPPRRDGPRGGYVAVGVSRPSEGPAAP